MVFVKVRETYDLSTVQNKMTVIAIHTPKPDIIKENYPGLLMQCKAYRPVSCDVRIACASVLPLDPLGVGTEAGDVAPEDIFNPILYKAMSNKGMSQLEARINNVVNTGASLDVNGPSAMVEVDDFTSGADDFNLYYGLLSQTRQWKHAPAQSGLTMSRLKPFVYEMVYNIGDTKSSSTYPPMSSAPDEDGIISSVTAKAILGKARPMPFINCTAYSLANAKYTGLAQSGFPSIPSNCSIDVPYLNVVCGAIIVPPSRLHKLYYRMVVEWTIEFSKLRPLGEIVDWTGLGMIGNATHYQNYSYSETKEAITGSSDSILDSDSCMVSANVDITKVM